MQRLHVDDLSGILIEQGWPKLVLPAIAVEAADYVIGADEVYHRPVGELLQPDRDSFEAIEELKREIGSRVFAAQYQQNPTPPDGNMIKAAWLGRYDAAPDAQEFSAGRAELRSGRKSRCSATTTPRSPSSACISRPYMCSRSAADIGRVMQMREQIIALAAAMAGGPRHRRGHQQRHGADPAVEGADPVSMSSAASPNADKVTRMSRQQGRFEAGRILLPNEALWLADFENELLAFPDGRYDDQVDALLLFLDWFAENERYLQPMTFPTGASPAGIGMPRCATNGRRSGEADLAAS